MIREGRAMLNLKELSGKKYRISLDESYEAGADDNGKLYYYQIQGRYGHIYTHGPERLGVHVKGRLKIGKVGAIPGLKLHQRGETEATYVFAPELLDRVATEIKAKKRRQLTDEQKARLIEQGTRELSKLNALRERAPDARSDSDEAA
jgi:hypothetical protein